jgi:hypothetical protein
MTYKAFRWYCAGVTTDDSDDDGQGEGSCRAAQSFDEFLLSNGMTTDTISAFRRIVAWRLRELMTEKKISTEELTRRLRTRPGDIAGFLQDPQSAPLLITTLREAWTAVGNPLISIWDVLQ